MARRTKVEGLRELEKSLGELTKAGARGALRRTLKKAGDPVAAAAIRLAPIDDGHLVESITVSTKKPKGADPGKRAFAEAMAGGASRAQAGAALRAARRAAKASGETAFAEVFVGPGLHPQAMQQEFGNENHPAQPFMRPAWDATQDDALRIITAEIEAEIDKAVVRAAKRAAKKRAKG